MDNEKLREIYAKHHKWLNSEGGGERAGLQRADLRYADLQRADLRGADLRGADLRRADLRNADLRNTNLRDADLQRADLQRADLRGADLRGADLRGAGLDFSCLPLWCGGSQFKADSKIVRQIIAHVCTLEIVDADDGMKAAIQAMRIEAVKSHRAKDLGIIEGYNEE